MRLYIGILFFLYGIQVFGQLRVPAVFCDFMVLQRDSGNPIWGWANPGEKITVRTSWGTNDSVVTGQDGRWMVVSYVDITGTGHQITISGNKHKIVIKEVALGEVWLCAGQSNMGWAVANSFGAEREASVNLPNFRIFRSAREHWHEPLQENRDRLARWKPCDPKSAAETSAVAYFFGKKLHEKLGVPVGIIQRAYAGTPIEGWMPWEIQSDDPRTQEHKKQLDENFKRLMARGQSKDKAITEFKRELAEYNARIDRGETMKNQSRSLSPPIITKPSNLGHQYPGHIFNAMIAPICPYAIRGMIWYQGERNAKNSPQAEHYRNQLKQMIGYYRNLWHGKSWGAVSDGFPVYFTQLPSWNPPQTKPVEGVESPWVVSRESMRRTSLELYNTGMAVTIDTGDAIELHPKNKKPIGVRHAYLALGKTYNLPIVHQGPVLSNFEIEGDQLILSFSSTGSGLTGAKSKKPLNSFALAGKNRVWYWADAKIQGNQIVLRSNEVSKPVAARYAWAMNPSQRNLLYNIEGFPASPFRTDDWPLYDPEGDLVEVTKPVKPKGYVAKDWIRPTLKN